MSPTIVGMATGIAAGIVLLAIGLGVWRSLRRRWLMLRMQEILRAEGGDALPARRGRRSPLPIRDPADVRFSFVMRDVERQPGDWRPWFRLSLAYADAGDRRRARKATRQALRLFAGANGPGTTAADTSA